MDDRLTQAEAGEAIYPLAFYVNWPNVFSAPPLAKRIREAPMMGLRDHRYEVNMNVKQLPSLGASFLALPLFCACGGGTAEQTRSSIVRIAELEIDPTQLESFKAELREEIEASIRLEPGVLTLYAVSLKESPTSIRILETYADADAYERHIESPHFKKYKINTEKMVKSLELVETDPVMLGAKGK